MEKVQRKRDWQAAWGTGYKNNGVPFISSSEVILGINTVVFKATLRSRPPKEDGGVYKQTQSEAVGRFTRAQASPLADLSSMSHFTGGVVLF